ncbi:DNA binding protein [Aureococcus anophagefferens]|nr:DNA binding protein [Aureococcus anophagefferens]
MKANHAILVLSLAGSARASVTVSSQFTNTHALSDSECYAPTDEGACDSDCTQRTDGVCDGTFLEQVIQGPSIKYAFCNDKWLILLTSGEGGVFEPTLNNVPSPSPAGVQRWTRGASLEGGLPRADKKNTNRRPLGVSDGVTYCTGDPTRTVDRYYSLQYPLDVVDFDEGVWTNNVDLFDGTAGNEGIPYLYDDGLGIGTYGLPDGAGVGITVNGMQNWVTQNNRGEWNQPTCETSPCNLHVGQGAGQPHVHGDLFSDSHQCLYGTSNYTTTASHPPIIGFGADGHLIYGRYLGDDAPGFAAPLLDECSGHTHDESTTDEYGVDLGTTYHYHTQIFDYTCGAGNDRCDDGDEVVISTTGPLLCFRADLSRQEGSSALLSFTTSDSYLSGTEMSYACCDMTDYYVITGNVFQNMDTFVADGTTCTVAAQPDNGVYASEYCETGDTLYSGNGCHVTCDDGYTASGITRCVEGAFVEYATHARARARADARADDGGADAPPSAAPTPGPTPAPTPLPASISGDFTVGGIDLATAEGSDVLKDAVVAMVQSYYAGTPAVEVTFSEGARRKLLADSVVVTYVVEVESADAADELATSLGAATADDWDAAISQSAEDSGFENIFADAATTSVSAPEVVVDECDAAVEAMMACDPNVAIDTSASCADLASGAASCADYGTYDDACESEFEAVASCEWTAACGETVDCTTATGGGGGGSKKSDGDDTGMIVGIVVALAVALGVVLVGVFAFVHYQSTMDQSAEMDGAPAKEMVPMKADDDEAPEESLAVSGGV